MLNSILGYILHDATFMLLLNKEIQKDLSNVGRFFLSK